MSKNSYGLFKNHSNNHNGNQMQHPATPSENRTTGKQFVEKMFQKDNMQSHHYQ